MSAGSNVAQVTTAAGETVVANERAEIHGVTLHTDGTNAANVKVYDGAAAGGKVRCEVDCAGSARFAGIVLQRPVKVATNISVVVTGTGAKATIYYGK